MSFSRKLESEYKVLAQEQFKGISFDKPEDFDIFFKAVEKSPLNEIRELMQLRSLHDKDSPEYRAIQEKINGVIAVVGKEEKQAKDHKGAPIAPSNKYEKVVAELCEFISECFDLYASDRIVELVTKVQATAARDSKEEVTPAFIPTNKSSSKEDKVQEARAALKAIVVNEFVEKLNKLYQLSPEERLKNIAEKKEERKTAVANQKRMADQKAPVGEASTAAAAIREAQEDALAWRHREAQQREEQQRAAQQRVAQQQAAQRRAAQQRRVLQLLGEINHLQNQVQNQVQNQLQIPRQEQEVRLRVGLFAQPHPPVRLPENNEPAELNIPRPRMNFG